MRFAIGRGFQVVGLGLVGTGFAVGLFGDDLRYEERMLFAGVLVFVVGWLLVKPYKAP